MPITREIYKLGFEISPIILTDGLAAAIPGGMLPIVTLTQGASFVSNLLRGSINITNLDRYFCHWRVQSGATAIDYDLARYPLASQKVAANALLAQPLQIPMIMDAPVNENTGVLSKMLTFAALQSSLEAHANLGGSFIVATPAVIYPNCLLRKMQDITPVTDAVPQRQWLFHFEKPLIADAEAERAVNSYLSNIDAGNPQTTSSWTNTASALGNTALGSMVSGLTDDITGLISKLMGGA